MYASFSCNNIALIRIINFTLFKSVTRIYDVVTRKTITLRMNVIRAQDALHILSDQAADREHEISRFSEKQPEESYDCAKSECPIIDTFYTSAGNDTVMSIWRFTLPELQLLKFILLNCITRSWNFGHGN